MLLANHVLSLITNEQLREPSDIVGENILTLQNSERYDAWFQPHPFFEGTRAVFELFEGATPGIQAKLYWLKKRSNALMAGAVHFTPNWEDAEWSRNENYKIGIDFFLSPDGSSVHVVLSNLGKLRVLELRDRLTNTDVEVLEKWFLTSESAPKENLHGAIWESFKLQTVNAKFYLGIAEAFTELHEHLLGLGKADKEAKMFSSRLLGRLLFVWFIRKMALINKDVQYFEPYGLDPSDYYRTQLERLFFRTFNTPINERRMEQDGTIDLITPYLSGGLFEPRPDDWKEQGVTFPEDFFTRLFNHFSDFNFTTDESTPDYEQVAIDPEMLGRVFESLLATQIDSTGEQARKAKGAFYTPREIVSFMCQDAVRQYLAAKSPEDTQWQEAISKLLETSDQEWAQASSNNLGRLSAEVRGSMASALSEMKTLDPACGSGAYPLGLLQLLTKLHSRLAPGRNVYELKLELLQRNIFGVDIEPMAVEISRLRSWLSLVVEQQGSDVVEPLPNLEFNFVCANSLGVLPGDDLFTNHDVEKRLEDLRVGYFRTSDPVTKTNIQREYAKLLQPDLFDLRSNAMRTFNPFDSEAVADFFDPKIMFGISDGFDVVVGNPPYISHDAISIAKDKLSKYQVHESFADIYCYFVEMGYRLLKAESGVLSFITSNSFLKAEYGAPLRRYIASKKSLRSLINVDGSQLFETATVNTAIFQITSSSNETVTAVNAKFGQGYTSFSNFVKVNTFPLSADVFDERPWVLARGAQGDFYTRLSKANATLDQLGAFIRLGIATGFNEAFIIDDQKRTRLIELDARNQEIIFPVLGGEDIARYKSVASKFILLTKNGIDVPEGYPTLLNYFNQFGDKFKARGAKGKHWTNLRACAFFDEFKNEKIMWIELANSGRFSYSNSEEYLLNSALFMQPPMGYDAKALTVLLNSKVINLYMDIVSQTSGMGTKRWIKATVEKFPIPPINDENRQLWLELAVLGESLIQDPDNELLERRGNEIVCSLYQISIEAQGALELL